MLNINQAKEVIKNKENINSFFIAVLCLSGLISFVTNLNNIIPIIVLVTLVILEILNKEETVSKIKNKEFKNKDTSLLFVILIAAMFLISIISKGIKETIIQRLFYFIGFIFIPYNCCRHKINIKSIINSILIISGVLSIFLFAVNFGKYDGGTRMAISYYMLPTYIAIIMSFFLEKKRSIKTIIIKTIAFIGVFYPYLTFLIKYISRGVILAILVCIFLCSIVNKSFKVKIITIAIMVLFIIVISFLLEPILYFANEVVQKLNIRVEIITKNLKLISEGNFDNGRKKVFEKAYNGIKEHPIIGNGIGNYTENYGTYPHNLVIQAWYEGGLVFFIAMLFVLMYSIYILIFDQNTDLNKKYILIFFITLSIIKLILSYEFWREISFGMYLYVVLEIMQEKWNNRRIKNGNSNNTNV